MSDVGLTTLVRTVGLDVDKIKEIVSGLSLTNVVFGKPNIDIKDGKLYVNGSEAWTAGWYYKTDTMAVVHLINRDLGCFTNPAPGTVCDKVMDLKLNGNPVKVLAFVSVFVNGNVETVRISFTTDNTWAEHNINFGAGNYYASLLAEVQSIRIYTQASKTVGKFVHVGLTLVPLKVVS